MLRETLIAMRDLPRLREISAVLFKRVFFIGLGLLGGHLLISG